MLLVELVKKQPGPNEGFSVGLDGGDFMNGSYKKIKTVNFALSDF